MSVQFHDGSDKIYIFKPHIRWMIRRDIEEVVQIESQAHSMWPWAEEDFLKHLRQRSMIGMVAEIGEKVVGFMVYELHKAKLEILNLAVDLNYKGKGIGQCMVDKLKAKLSQHRRTYVSIHVRETNLPAQLFFKHVGFQATKTKREYFTDSGEDAYVMRYVLVNTPEPAPEVEDMEQLYGVPDSDSEFTPPGEEDCCEY